MDAIRVSTVDYHTAGEPFRIVLDGGPTIPGASVLERREAAATRPEIDQVPCQTGESFGLALRGAHFDADVLTFDVAVLAQAPAHPVDGGIVETRHPGENPDNRHLRLLLSECGRDQDCT